MMKFEVRDAAKKGYVDDVEKISSADNALTSVGKAGLGWGNLSATAHDILTEFVLDNFIVTEVDAAVEPPNLVMAPYRPA